MHKRIRREHANADIAVVFIHGFMGSPSQFAGLADAAYARGCSCISVLLPGHGENIREFARFGAKDWQACVQNELDEIKQRYSSIFLVGHSIGGLLALNASTAGENRVAGVVLISTPLKFNLFNPKSIKRKLCLLTLPKNREVRSAYRNANSVAISNPLLYPLVLKPACDAIRLARDTKRRLPEITAPICMFHSKNDEMTSYKSGGLLYKGLLNAQRTAFELKESRHAYYSESEWEMIKVKLMEMISSV